MRWLIGFTLLAIACNDGNGTYAIAPSGAPDMKTGSWGGTQAELRIENDRPAQLDLPCAHARIDRPLVIANDGSFEWKARYVQERPGPAREDEGSAGNAGVDARIRGRIDDKDRVTLNVIVDGKTVAGPLTLDFGKASRLVKCG
jgi:hypothetical protein